MRHRQDWGIWALALGYFACYAPYSALTKALSRGLLPGMTEGVPGLELLPGTVLASMVGMFAFLTWKGWWRYAGHREILGVSLPAPGLWTLLSGLATAAIVATTTLAYTFAGVSIVFMMLLMRGGVLVVAPVVDAISGRRVRWFSWTALGLSLAALLAALSDFGSYDLTVPAVATVAIYLAGYFFRLRSMSRLAKSDEADANRRFFVEEQMVATPAAVAILAVLALVGGSETSLTIREGFTGLLGSDVLLASVVVGLLSQGTGVFGGLILLDKRENSFCVPVNRSSSILAGLAASYGLAAAGQSAPSGGELAGAALIVAAILFLTVPDLLRRRREPATVLTATR